MTRAALVLRFFAVLFLVAGHTALAQDAAPADAEAPAEEAAPADTSGQDAGPVPAAAPPSEISRETFGAWELQCTPDKSECRMFKLAVDAAGSPVAEIRIFKSPPGAGGAGVVQVVTPLGTLLTAGFQITVDGEPLLTDSYDFCLQEGCYVQFALEEQVLTAFQRGANATLRVLSANSPDQPIDLVVSLTGFTAGHSALTAE